MRLPTNRSLTVTRVGTTVMTGLAAFVQPASDQLVALQGTPGAKLYLVLVSDLPDVREQDTLSSTTPAETYVVRGVKRFDTPRLAHLELTCEATWGS